MTSFFVKELIKAMRNSINNSFSYNPKILKIVIVYGADKSEAREKVMELTRELSQEVLTRSKYNVSEEIYTEDIVYKIATSGTPIHGLRCDEVYVSKNLLLDEDFGDRFTGTMFHIVRTSWTSKITENIYIY